MLKKYLQNLSILFFTVAFISCGDDDNNYVAILIETNVDSAEVAQNNSVIIDVLSNDINVPDNGTLNAIDTQNGTTQILDQNETPNNPFDDVIIYTPNIDFVGNDSFEYTICDDNNNCASGLVTIVVTPVSTVNFDLGEIPYATLSEYDFFDGVMKEIDAI